MEPTRNQFVLVNNDTRHKSSMSGHFCDVVGSFCVPNMDISIVMPRIQSVLVKSETHSTTITMQTKQMYLCVSF